MQIIWANKQSPSQTSVAPMPFIVWDFLKMFTAAIVYGVCISLVAAGIALLLAADPETERVADSNAYRPTTMQPASTGAPASASLQNRI